LLLAAAPSVLAQGKTLVVLKSAAEAARLDPHRDQSHPTAEITTLLTDSLVSIDADLQTVKPHLAQSWTVSKDGRTYLFNLRKDVKYCSGRAMTAKDVVGTFARWRDPATRSASRYRIASVDTVRAVDDYTVEMKLSRPDNELLLQLGTHFAGIIDPEQAAELKDNFGVTAFNGVGPFCLERWIPRQEVVLKRHEAYRWGPPQFDNKGPAKVERIVFKSVPEESTLAATLMSADGMLTSALADWAKEKVMKDPNIAYTTGRAVGFSPTLHLRVSKPPLNDVLVRRALAMAINRPQLAKAVWGKNAVPAWSMAAPSVRDADPMMDKLAFQYDKAGAGKLLDEAGWKMGADGVRVRNGEKLSLVVYAQDLPQWRNALGAIHGMWRDVGVDLQLRLWEPQVAFAKLASPEWNLSLYNHIHTTAGDGLNSAFHSKNLGGSNRIGWNDPETDRLLDAAQATLSEQERKKLYRELQERLMAAQPVIPLYNDQRQTFYNKTMVKGVKGFGTYGVMLYKALDIEVLR
jgi:peptide/nickel transport system substrate-binding protein